MDFSTREALISLMISAESLVTSQAPNICPRSNLLSEVDSIDSSNFVINLFLELISSLFKKLKYLSKILFEIASAPTSSFYAS